MTTDQLALVNVTLPSLGENVTEATITRWLKSPGESIAEGEALLEVATDKVDTEVPAPISGVLHAVIATENDVLEVGGTLGTVAPTATVAAAAEPPPQPAPSQSAPPALQRPKSPVRPADPPKPVVPVGDSAASRVVKLPRIRQTIARRMLESLQTSAQLTTVLEVDVTGIKELRSAHKEEFYRRTGIRLSFFPFFVKAAVSALAEHPELNASLNSDMTEVTYHGQCHLGIAVDSEKGLMVPVVRNAESLSITRLSQAIADVAERVRSNKITADELAGGTFTLTNTGSRGALFDTPIINQPQTGILGTGAVVDRVVPLRNPDGNMQIGVRSMVYLSISYDHRIVDGADAARYLTAVKERLEQGFTAAELV